MIQIESHIEKLLLSHDCVIVPGIGGFVTRFEGSYVDGDEICPPYRSVSFNSQLKDNDGLLAQSYMAAYDTSYPGHSLLLKRTLRKYATVCMSGGNMNSKTSANCNWHRTNR